jgi:hypothetical protein
VVIIRVAAQVITRLLLRKGCSTVRVDLGLERVRLDLGRRWTDSWTRIVACVAFDAHDAEKQRCDSSENFERRS